MDDTLGRAGGAAGIDDVEGVAALGREIGRASSGRGHPCVELLVEDDPGEAFEAAPPEFGQFRAVDEDVIRPRVARHFLQLTGAGAGSQRRGDTARADRGQEHQRIRDRGCPEDRDRLPAFQSLFDKARRDPLDPVGHLGPCQPACLVAQGDRIGVRRGPGSKRRGEIAIRFGEAGGDVAGVHRATLDAPRAMSRVGSRAINRPDCRARRRGSRRAQSRSRSDSDRLYRLWGKLRWRGWRPRRLRRSSG